MLWLLRVLPPNLKTEHLLDTYVSGYGTLLIEQASSVFHSCFKEFGNLRSLFFCIEVILCFEYLSNVVRHLQVHVTVHH